VSVLASGVSFNFPLSPHRGMHIHCSVTSYFSSFIDRVTNPFSPRRWGLVLSTLCISLRTLQILRSLRLAFFIAVGNSPPLVPDPTSLLHEEISFLHSPLQIVIVVALGSVLTTLCHFKDFSHSPLARQLFMTRPSPIFLIGS